MAPTDHTPTLAPFAGAKDSGSTVTVYVEQLRAGEVVWAGTVVIWDNEQGPHGRRHPSGSCGPNQWQAGDIIRPSKPHLPQRSYALLALRLLELVTTHCAMLARVA